MRLKSPDRPSRRQVLRGLTAFGAAAVFATGVRAQSSTDPFELNRVLRNTDKAGNTTAALDAIDTVEPILSFDTAYNLQLAIQRYERLVAEGGWKPVPRDINGLAVGIEREVVSRLRDRLIISGDIAAEFKTRRDLFDEHLDMGVRRFQARHGLIVTGKIDAPTYFTLNISAEYRLSQLRLNAMRVENFAARLSDRYIVVNIPAATIEAIDAAQVLQRHTAVVGRIDRPTPILDSTIQQINFNPYWHVPKSIIRKDLIKYMNEDPEYLAKYKIHIYDDKGTELLPTAIDWSTDDAVNYLFRQEPGGENSMGHVKINFPNKHDVYLHDTPNKSLFGENARFHSSGCVRVEGVNELVAWILAGNGDWDLPSVDAVFASNERLDVAVKEPVPIHTTYITAWANRQGTVSFRDDVYQYDEAGQVMFEG